MRKYSHKTANGLSIALFIAAILFSVLPIDASAMVRDDTQSKQFKCLGKVVDSNNQPVDGAEVKLYILSMTDMGRMSFSIDLLKESVTNSDGEFSFECKPEGGYAYSIAIIVAEKEGLSIGWTNWELESDTDHLEITLTEPKTLAGVVVDENDEPIEDAKVSILIMFVEKDGDIQGFTSYGREDFFAMQTDSEGKFEFSNIPEGAKAGFLVTKPGRAATSDWRGDINLKYSAGQTDIKLVQLPEARIEGKVIEKATGEPIEGVIIGVALQESTPFLGIEEAVSKEDGTFVIDALPEGKITLQTKPGDKEGWASSTVEVETKAGKTTTDITIELGKGGILEVKVTDSQTNLPVEEAQVSIMPLDAMQGLNEQTNEEGIATIRLSAGEYHNLNAYKQGYTSRRQEENITIEDGKTTRIDIELIGQPKIKGVVLDKQGRPLEDASIQIVPMGGGRRIVSDANGKFETEWYPERYSSSEMTSYIIARDEENNQAEAVIFDEDTKEIEVKLRDGLTFTGSVSDVNDEPIENARISVYFRAGNYSTSINRSRDGRQGNTTDAEGKFEINALPQDSEYYLYASAEGYGRKNVQVDIYSAKNNIVDTGKVQLSLANLIVSGTVIDTDDEPLEGAEVYSYGDSQPEGQRVTTGKDGKFTLKACEGMIRINANYRDGSNYMYGSAQAEGGATDVKIIITPRGTSSAYVPRQPESLKGKSLPDSNDLGIEISADANDKMLLVCFWDYQQRPSRHAVNQLKGRLDELKKKGVRIIIVQASIVDKDELQQHIERYEIPFVSGMIEADQDKTRFKWGVRSLPWLILADSEKNVIIDGFNINELDEKIKQTVGE